MRKTIQTAAMSPSGVHSSRWQLLEQCEPTGNVATVHTVLPTDVPVNFTKVIPFAHKNRTALWSSSHHMLMTVTCAPSLLVVHASLAKAGHEKTLCL